MPHAGSIFAACQMDNRRRLLEAFKGLIECGSPSAARRTDEYCSGTGADHELTQHG